MYFTGQRDLSNHLKLRFLTRLKNCGFYSKIPDLIYRLFSCPVTDWLRVM